MGVFSIQEKASRIFETPANTYLWDVLLFPPQKKTVISTITDIAKIYVDSDFLPNTVQSRILGVSVPFYTTETDSMTLLGSDKEFIKGRKSGRFSIEIPESEAPPTTLGYLLEWFRRQMNINGTVNEPVFYEGKAYIILKSRIAYSGVPLPLPTKVFYLQGVYPILPDKLMDLKSQAQDSILSYSIPFSFSNSTPVEMAEKLKSWLTTASVISNISKATSGDTAASRRLAGQALSIVF